MAIYHFHTKIIKASHGKCAVASSAYISGGELYDERLGKWFAYTNKEEVVYTEVMLPKNAPADLQDRETLWNEVERVQNRSNSRYARQFDMALPIELSREQRIELSREYIIKNFVELGMAADFAIHEKEGNPHLHVICTVRGFKKDGSWATMEKKEYARDENGEKIPEIDPKTGKQKVRIRKGKGEEKLWKRITAEANNWNKREQLVRWRKAWADECNRYLSEKDHIDHRSYEEQGIDRVPTIHEGYIARKKEARGEISERISDNLERRKLNAFLDKLDTVIREAKKQIGNVKSILEKLSYGKEECIGRTTSSRGSDEYSGTVQRSDPGAPRRNKETEIRKQKTEDGVSAKIKEQRQHTESGKQSKEEK